MQGYKKDQQVVNEGRTSKLDPEKIQKESNPTATRPAVSKRDKICDKLIKKLRKENVGEFLASKWFQANADRAEWLKRQEQLLQEYDEFLVDIYPKSFDWSSTIHLPISFTVAKTYHARMFAALMDLDPPFTTVARQSANVDRARLVQELMRYSLKSWCNEYQGVEDAVDRWLWDWVTAGVGILKGRWHTKYSRYYDIVERKVPTTKAQVNAESGLLEYVPSFKIEESEEEITKKLFAGPMLERVSYEDLVIVGGEGDPQKADFVAQSQMMTASEMWTLADEGIFDETAVENIIAGGAKKNASDATQTIKQERALQAGVSNSQATAETDRYRVIEAYCKLDVDGSGISADIVVWMNPESRELLHANYLYRREPSGLIPYFKIDFYKRNGQVYGIGIIELLYSLSKEMDAMHNIRVDTGILTSMPFGFYRPTSSMTEETLPISPGAMIPLDNPQTDIFFPNLGGRTGFGLQEEQNLNSWIERLTSISDLSLGLLGAQGAARTATGARALVGEANANLNIFVRRMNAGWKRALNYTFNLLQRKLEPGFQFRLFGDDGDAYWAQIPDREALAGMYDFELESNSANSNKSLQVETANQIYQMTANPIDMQLGLISPAERFEAVKNLLQQMGVKDWSRYIRKPSQIGRQFTPEELANRILAGVAVQLDPSQDLQGFMAYVDHIFEHDELLGQFKEDQAIALAKKRQEAEGILGAMAQQAAQVANMRQQQVNQQVASPGATPAGSITPASGPTDGSGGGDQPQ